MKAILCFLLILQFSATEQTTALHQGACPPWFNPNGNSSAGCFCTDFLSAIKCDPDFPLLRLGYCMAFNSANGATEFGPCPYITRYNTTTNVDHAFYIQLPSNVSLLNEFMCGPLNREGPLCGKCKDGYGIALYSYTLECSKCWGHGYGWVLYYFLELFPITVMYFVVIIFHIRATSSPLSVLVFMSQIVVYTIRLNVPFHMYIENEVTGFPYVALKVLLVLCGIWSLDFFRSVIPPFCVSSNIKTVHALALEYLVAFYPIFLILITYVCIKLHDNNIRPVVWLWKPFHRHFVHLRRRWDSTASIINAFTTFLLLSFSKILYVSFTLLYTFHIQNNHGNHLSKCVLYYDSTVECHTQEYAIFAAIAGCVLAIFIICPTLLILYPTRLFRRCISCCGFRRWHALHMFVESFQGQYKDGTNGTRDLRMVSALYLIVRMLTMASFLGTICLFQRNSLWVSAALQCSLLIGASGICAVMRPYKLNIRNNIDYLVLTLLEIFSAEVLLAVLHVGPKSLARCVLVSALLFCVPHMVLILYVCYVLAMKAGITQYLKRILKRCMQAISLAQKGMEAQSDTDSLPDRLINPGEYEPVLPTTEEHTAAELTEDEEPDNEEPRRLTPVYTYGSV